MERGLGDALGRLLRSVAALGLAIAAGGAVLLVLEARIPATVSVMTGRTPGSVLLLGVGEVGEYPFTSPIAVDLSLDPLLLAVPPRTGEAAASPHHRASQAERLVAHDLAPALARVLDLDATPTVPALRRVVDGAIGAWAVVEHLEDRDGDLRDDDGRFSVMALDGSAVCVSVGSPRRVARAVGAPSDADGVPVTGVSWTPFGPCDDSTPPGIGADVRVGTTPGTYGAVTGGDVCDVSALRLALAADPELATVWGGPLGLAPEEAAAFLDSLTPVVLLGDTAVTDHARRGAGVAARQAILERGTAVLVDLHGTPRVRCMSGAPLRAPQELPDDVQVRGNPWPGFSLDAIRRIPAGERVVSSFVLIDVHTGQSLRRTAGIDGVLTRLAGPLVRPASG